MTHSVVKSVEALGVHTIQLAHTLREITLRRFDEQVIVVVHETVAIANPIEALADFREYCKPAATIRIIQVDVLPGVSPGGNVV
jgi:hypothetical protein